MCSTSITSPSSASAASRPTGRSIVCTDRIELLKWLGCVAMLYEHAAHFVIGDRAGWPIYIGRAAFPMFALALAAGIAHKTIADQYAVSRRLLAWGLVSILCVALVKDSVPLNILLTFALAVALEGVRRSGSRYWIPIWIAALPLAMTVEYGPLGVLGVVALIRCCRSHGWRAWAWLAAGAACIAASPGNVVSAVWWPLIVALAAVPAVGFVVPRVRGAFYWIYAGQWPVIAIARAVL